MPENIVLFPKFSEDENSPTQGAYVRFSRFIVDDREGVVIGAAFDGIVAAWMDQNLETAADIFFENAPLIYLEVLSRTWNGRDWPPFEEMPEESRWHYFRTRRSGDGVVLRYHSGVRAPVRLSLEEIGEIPRVVLDRLTDIASLDSIPDTELDEISAIITPKACKDRLEGVLVYDVGQGNCNALLSDNLPLIYFDFGGGCGSHRKTFPGTLRSFCLKSKPPVILSHWHEDHWSSAERDSRVIYHNWIVPRQTIGLRARKLAYLIGKHGRLLIWPNKTPYRNFGAIEIAQCTGTLFNDSGLALTIASNEVDDEYLLLPGDAHYAHIPNATKRKFRGIVASHHGGVIRVPGIPAPSSTHHRICYSYGKPNSHNHPNKNTVSAHKAAGWVNQSETANNGLPRGNAGIFWNNQTLPVKLSCKLHRPDIVISK